MVSLGVLAAATALHEVLENKRIELLNPIAVAFAALSFVINSISVYSTSACTVVAALIVLGFIAYNSYQTPLDLKTFILDVSP